MAKLKKVDIPMFVVVVDLGNNEYNISNPLMTSELDDFISMAVDTHGLYNGGEEIEDVIQILKVIDYNIERYEKYTVNLNGE